MTEKFKILTPREHVRERAGMYLGSVSNDTIDRFVKGVWGSYIYVPALFKMVNEIIDNSIDEALRTNFKFANLIDVSIDQSGIITVTDNGRGIPQNLVKDSATGEDLLQPVAAWTRTNAGTSFTEDRITIGANGVGAAATNYLSKKFVGTTWSNGSCVNVSCVNGAESVEVKLSKKSGSGTSVSFQPDFSFFETSSVFDDDLVSLVEDRLISLQLAFPEISFSFNKKKIPITDIKKYAQLFVQDGASVIIEKTDNVSFFFAASEDGFRTNSFLNGVNTYLGGTYVDYIMNTIVEELVVLIKKKHKIEVNKSTIKSGLSFVLFVRNFVNPKFDSQTKERLTSSAGSAKEHYEKSGAKDLKQMAKKIFAADDIIEPLIAAQIAKKNADELRDAKVAQKKLKKVKVAKHISATSTEASLALCEGDCIEENTQIHTLNGSKAIKDIQIGDYVFTHKNRYQPVESRSFALKEGIRLNGVIYSQNHRLFVYDTKDRKFKIKHVKDIDRNTDKIIKNRLIKNDFDSMMNIVESVSDDGIVVTDKKTMKFSKEHEILYLTDELSIETRVFLDLIPGDIIIL